MSRYRRTVFLCCPLWLLAWYTGHCQNTHGGLAVPKVPANRLSATLTDLNGTNADTAEIRLLLKLSYIYYWQDQARHHYYGVDSAIFFAQQAKTWSTRINFTEGLTESEFLLCRVLIDRS